ncbi:hypothetical protein F5Y13DRAFT_103576 [Hypoxylon sp. FL1857]|nr:hypothetical protein F5Y13DRAFT_103576 [Hypoxylon sp. FL1857]
MDPVSAVGVAAAAMQFAEITFKITKRIAVFATLRHVPDDAEGPKAFVERLRNQLGLLDSAVQRIEEGLRSYQEGFRDDELLILSGYVSNLNRQGGKLDDLLTHYLPDDAASTSVRLLAALKSIASDLEIESVMASINQLLPLLTTFLLTSMAFKSEFLLSRPRVAGTNTEPGQRQPTSSTIYHVSRHEVRSFVDRPGVLTEINRLFDDQPTLSPRIVILQGMGGQGKTQLALRYCANARLQKQFNCILWIDAATRASTVRGLEDASEELNHNNLDLSDADARIAFVRRQLTTANSSWLLVLDNYDDPASFDLREYIPKCPLGYVLITSRSTDTERIGSMMHISGMTEDEATRLLFKQLDASEDLTNRTAATDIVRRLGYLPLAIDQAGAYMKAEGVPLVDFLSYYDRSARDIFNSVPSLWEYTQSAPSGNGEEATDVMAKTVFTTWDLSFSLLKPDTSTGCLKATVLYLLAFFHEHEISEEYFQAYCSANLPHQRPEWMSLFTDEKGQWSSRKFDTVMREFSRLSLITTLNTERKDTEYAVISLHPLVRDWINLRQENSVHKANFVEFTQMLGAVLLPELQNQSSLEPGFDWPFLRRRQLHAHVTSWMNIFRKYKLVLRLTIVTSEYEGHSMVTCTEQLIAMYLFGIGLSEDSLELSQWIWELCDLSDSHMLRVKFMAGFIEIRSLWSLNLFEEGKRRSREKLHYWKAIFGNDASYDDMLYKSVEFLIDSLLYTVSWQDTREALELCRSQLEKLQNDERNMTRRHRLLTNIMVAARVLGQNDVLDATLESILNETVRCDGNDSWMELWDNHILFQVTLCAIAHLEDLDTLDQLSRAAVEVTADTGGWFYFQLRIFRALALSKMGKSAEGEAMIRDRIAELALLPLWDGAYIDAYEALGNVLKDQERYEESYEAYNSALLQLQGPELQNSKLRILDRCAVVAERFNLELADALWTLRLSLVNETDYRDDIVGNIMDLYRIKAYIGTTQDNLELLVDGLELYGVEFVYRKNNIQRPYLRQISAVIDLNGRESCEGLEEDGIVQTALMEKLDVWYGFQLLIRMAVQLLRTENTAPAEQAFGLAKTAFGNMKDIEDKDINSFIYCALCYAEECFEVDGDGRRARDTLDWAVLQIRERLGNGVEYRLSEQLARLMDLIEPPKTLSSRLAAATSLWAKPISSKAMRRLSVGLSRTRSFKLPGFSSSRPRLTIRRGLESVHNVAALSPITTTVGLQDRHTLQASKSSTTS